MPTVDPLSAVPLHLETILRGRKIGDATGFLIARDSRYYLVTNWHVVTGRHPDTRQPLNTATAKADPDQIGIWHHDSADLRIWHKSAVNLLDPSSGKPLWREHPSGGSVDVVALQVDIPPGSEAYPLPLELANVDLVVLPSEPVSIIGFPLGLSGPGNFRYGKQDTSPRISN